MKKIILENENLPRIVLISVVLVKISTEKNKEHSIKSILSNIFTNKCNITNENYIIFLEKITRCKINIKKMIKRPTL